MKIIYFFTALLFLASCQDAKKIEEENVVESKVLEHTLQDKILNLKNPDNNQIIVVAHRGDWRNAPENSIKAIENAIDMGVDMVEIDIRETSDGHLVLMHDDSIGRTTTGRGLVKNWSLDSLRTLRLRDGLGAPTEQQIPTLEEALLTSKNKILVNLDKSYKIFDKCYDVIKSTGTINQVIIKGGKTRQEVEQEFGDYIDKVIFMPVIWSSNKSDMVVQDYLENRKPIAFEFIIPEDTINLGPYFKKIRDKGSSVWVNSLWPRLSGGHSDDRALIDINIYQWYIDNHVDIIQTDRPELLLEFLRSKGLHQ